MLLFLLLFLRVPPVGLGGPGVLGGPDLVGDALVLLVAVEAQAVAQEISAWKTRERMMETIERSKFGSRQALNAALYFCSGSRKFIGLIKIS